MKKAKELRIKAKRYAQAEGLNEAQERRAYQLLKQIYKESTPKEREKLGL